MSTHARPVLLTGLMLVLLAAVAVWSTCWMLTQRARAQAASEELNECRALAETVRRRRLRLTAADDEAMASQELSRRINQALRQARLRQEALKSKDPKMARREAGSPYLLMPTALVLQNVSLREVATFLHVLTEDSPLKVRDLRLRGVRDEATEDVWTADVTVTYLVYAPVESRSNK